jgi:hypothetical protein
MKRLLLVFVTLAVTISLAATPSMAAAKSTVGLAPQAPSDPSAIYVPADDLAKTLRDKMPFISSEPTLVGNNLIWDVDIAPMRLKAKKGVTLLDRVGGTVFVSRAGVDIRRLTKGNAKSRLTLTKVVPSRVITKAGPQQFQITLPANLARELRALPSSAWASRVGVVMWNDKDTNPAIRGYDRRQLTSTTLPSAISDYLASRRSSAPQNQELSSTQTNTPGTIVVYNGSPFNLAIDVSTVQCNMSPWFLGNVPTSVTANSSVEWFNIGSIAGYWYYMTNQSYVQASAEQPGEIVGKQAESSLEEGALVKYITGDFSKGLNAFLRSFAGGLVIKGVLGAIASFKKEAQACTNAGTAMTLAWSNLSLGTGQTDGNVNYWVPSFNQTSNMVGVPPVSLPTVAPGSPLTGYNATSQNGLAVAPSVLQRELGLGGSVTLTTLNSNQKNGNYIGFWCNFTNQQIGNPNSTTPTSQYGSTSLGGGTTAAWGPCNATSVNTDADYNASNYNFSGPGSDLENEGFTFLIGYSTTSYNTAGPHPAIAQPTTSTSSQGCIASAAPCAFLTPETSTQPASIGCTPGTWNMLTPWNATSSTMNLSSPPSAYNADSQLNMQLAFTGVTASGTPVTYFAPTNLGGSVTSSFSPSTINLWQLSPANLAAVQNVLGGPGGYVTEWMCVMTAATTIPSGIPPTSTAMNLGWYGVPVIVPLANPAGNILSPPA